jgi:hypothetical protein
MVWVGLSKLCIGHDEEALAWLRRSVEINRNVPPHVHFYLAASLALLDRLGEARAELRAGRALDPAFSISRFRAGAPSDNPTHLAQRERIYDGMRKAGVPEG